jgi:hypothetical protein
VNDILAITTANADNNANTNMANTNAATADAGVDTKQTNSISHITHTTH